LSRLISEHPFPIRANGIAGEKKKTALLFFYIIGILMSFFYIKYPFLSIVFSKNV